MPPVISANGPDFVKCETQPVNLRLTNKKRYNRSNNSGNKGSERSRDKSESAGRKVRTTRLNNCVPF